jgi:hypothetical protein
MAKRVLSKVDEILFNHSLEDVDVSRIGETVIFAVEYSDRHVDFVECIFRCFILTILLLVQIRAMVIPSEFGILDELGIVDKRTVTCTRRHVLNYNILGRELINVGCFSCDRIQNSFAS